MHKLQSHAQIEPAPLDAERADVPKELVAIASRMMAKNPAERYLTPKEVADALESFLRTWRPEEATSQGQEPQAQEPSSGGNMSGSEGKKSRVGDAGWDWWFVLARLLLAIACIPISLIFYEAWIFDVESYPIGRVGDLVPAYLLPALFLSILSGLVFLFQRSNADLGRSTDGERRLVGMKASEALTVAAVIVAGGLATVLYYLQVNKWTYIEANGSVVAFSPQERTQTVTSPVEGIASRISDSLVEGADVKENDFLVEIELNNAELVASAAQLEAQLAAVALKAKSFEERVTLYQAQKTVLLASVEAMIKTAQANLDALEADQKQAQSDFDQRKVQYDRGLVSEFELNTAATNLKSARLKVEAAKRELDEKQSELSQKELDANLKINSAQTQHLDASAEVAALEKRTKDIAVKLSEPGQFLITAPKNGTLIRSNLVKQGQAIKEGDELFTIDPHTSERAVELRISRDNASLVQRGDRVQLQFEGWPVVGSTGLYGGRVESIAPVADDVGMFRIVVNENDNNSWPDERYLRPGVRAEGWVWIESR